MIIDHGLYNLLGIIFQLGLVLGGWWQEGLSPGLMSPGQLTGTMETMMVCLLYMYKLHVGACKIMQVQCTWVCTWISTCTVHNIHNDVHVHVHKYDIVHVYSHGCVGGEGKTGKAVILKDWNESSFVSGALYSVTQCYMYNSNLA